MPFKDKRKMTIVERIRWEEILDEKEHLPCEECGTFKNLTFHHIDQSRLLVYEPHNIKVLCETCHKKVHNIRITERRFKN